MKLALPLDICFYYAVFAENGRQAIGSSTDFQ
jgi:hypothetical protein